jgi:hypothetical protein
MFARDGAGFRFTTPSPAFDVLDIVGLLNNGTHICEVIPFVGTEVLF